ncbi:unnamed protein product [Pleuronectes platessa]|uniref:Uncharacterized protein n=1 Tax=Pleuronectes platessa TaxID=8262 RepID=A0A9N7UHC1_PLEPL|nr:unnamed protein product [Pleuronectes platessa]
MEAGGLIPLTEVFHQELLLKPFRAHFLLTASRPAQHLFARWKLLDRACDCFLQLQHQVGKQSGVELEVLVEEQQSDSSGCSDPEELSPRCTWWCRPGPVTQPVARCDELSIFRERRLQLRSPPGAGDAQRDTQR